jgi:hypothetical protein
MVGQAIDNLRNEAVAADCTDAVILVQVKDLCDLRMKV